MPQKKFREISKKKTRKTDTSLLNLIMIAYNAMLTSIAPGIFCRWIIQKTISETNNTCDLNAFMVVFE